MLMAEQLDHMGGDQLRRKIESMGVKVHTSKNTKEIVQEGTEARKPCALPTAASSKLTLSSSQPVFAHATTGHQRSGGCPARRDHGERYLPDLDPDIYAIGECASWNNRVYGLVAPGYKWRRSPRPYPR